MMLRSFISFLEIRKRNMLEAERETEDRLHFLAPVKTQFSIPAIKQGHIFSLIITASTQKCPDKWRMKDCHRIRTALFMICRQFLFQLRDQMGEE